MPAGEEEVEAALQEGVNIHFLANPTRIMRENGRLKMECIRNELGEVDASGRRRPVPIEGSEFVIDVDTVIAAIGQNPEDSDKFGVPVGRGGTFEIDPDTLATSREGVYAGGDAVTGPASVIEAIAAGRQVACSIDRYLGGSGNIDETLAPPEVEMVRPEEEEKGRPEVPSLNVEERLKGFAEVELGLTEEMAVEEAKRCLWCDREEY
jgi:NADPH-dependent glutamate synthase beta subunit-like oxidoreductase